MNEYLERVRQGLADMGVSERNDDNLTMVFARELEHIAAKTYDIRYPDNVGRKLLPLVQGVSAADTTYTYRQFDYRGEAKLVSNYMPGDFPLAETQGEEVSCKIKSFGNGYRYTLEELRAAAQLGRPLDMMKAAAARRILENKLDALICTGATEGATSLFKGIANATGVDVSTKANAGAWSTKTVAQIAADVQVMWKDVVTDTKGVFGLNDKYKLVVPLSAWIALQQKHNAVDTRHSLVTAEQELKNLIPQLGSIVPWNRLETAGASSATRCIWMPENADVAELLLPVEFEQFAPVREGLSFVTLNHMRCGGVVVRYPDAIRYMDGI